jgi:hypothetical protein
MNKIFLISSLVLSIYISGCGLFAKRDFDIVDKDKIEKMKEDALKQANELAGKDDDKRNRLMKDGKEAPAIIDKIEDTRVTVNKNPKIRMYLKVKPKGEEEFDAVAEMVVSRVNIPRTGDKVTVYYNPNERTDLIVK